MAQAAESGENAVYFGVGGSVKSDSIKSNEKPLSVGYMRLSNTTNSVYGFDIAREGTMLDSTYGKNNSVRSGTSYNALVGLNLSKSDYSRFDVALLIGAREKTKSCPSSYLGYQCYANTDPDSTYTVNYGLVATGTYKSVLLGARVTGESAQAMLGLRF